MFLFWIRHNHLDRCGKTSILYFLCRSHLIKIVCVSENKARKKEKKMSLQSLQYSRGSLKVLDQLLLPHESKYIDVENTEGAWAVIRSMQVRGAPLIAITAALGLAVDMHNRRHEFVDNKSAAVDFLLKSMDYLRTSRPTAVNLFTAMDELTKAVQADAANTDIAVDALVENFILAAEKIFADDIQTNRAIGMHGAKKILELVPHRDRIRVLTICNTGSLATADYGTALGVVRALHDLGKLEHVYACETRPYNQGARLTAYEIVQDKLPGTLITDSMASALMALKGVDCVVVGADRIAANGDTANKIGTYQLAITANYHHVPFFTAAPTTTIDLSMASGAEIHVEERPAVELTSIFGQKIAPDGIQVWNPSFDVTPCSLIRGVITELGVIEPELPDPKGMSANAADPVIPIAQYLAARAQENAALHTRIAKAAQPIAVPIGYDRLNEEKIAAYVLKQEKLVKILGLSTEQVHETLSTAGSTAASLLKIQEVGDGNLNFVYIIEALNPISGVDAKKTVVKQALPFVRCVGESWPLTLQRAYFEYSALVEEYQATEGKYVPQVYLFDHSKCLMVMEFIAAPHLILRKHLIASERVTSFATDLGHFLAATLFKSSALYLSGSAFRKQVAKWSENVSMCALTEKVIFTDPYNATCSLNHWTQPYLDTYIQQGIFQDSLLKQAASYHKNLFIGKAEALLHADLHTGSVMACEGSTYVIDPEFAFYGPMGFDLGAIISNLYLAYFAHSVDENSNEGGSYAEWILAQIELLHTTFTQRFKQLWDETILNQGGGSGELYVAGVYSAQDLAKAQHDWMATIWRDTLGFAGSKMIRRIVGIAHVADLESIADLEKRSIAEKRALLFARKLVLASYLNEVQSAGLTSVQAVNDNVARPIFGSTPAEAWPTTA
jgi:5-methylthioribose kinase